MVVRVPCLPYGSFWYCMLITISLMTMVMTDILSCFAIETTLITLSTAERKESNRVVGILPRCFPHGCFGYEFLIGPTRTIRRIHLTNVAYQRNLLRSFKLSWEITYKPSVFRHLFPIISHLGWIWGYFGFLSYLSSRLRLRGRFPS